MRAVQARAAYKDRLGPEHALRAEPADGCQSVNELRHRSGRDKADPGLVGGSQGRVEHDGWLTPRIADVVGRLLVVEHGVSSLEEHLRARDERFRWHGAASRRGVASRSGQQGRAGTGGPAVAA